MILQKLRRSNWKDHVARPSPSISGVSMRVRKYIPEALPRPVVLDPTLRIYLWPPLASFTCLWPLAAQRNGEKRMCSPVYLLMLPVCEKLALLTGIHRVGPCPSIASCGRAVSCLINTLADGAEAAYISAVQSRTFRHSMGNHVTGDSKVIRKIVRGRGRPWGRG